MCASYRTYEIKKISLDLNTEVQFGQFIVSCFATHAAPCPAICKSGRHACLPCHMESAPVRGTAINCRKWQ